MLPDPLGKMGAGAMRKLLLTSVAVAAVVAASSAMAADLGAPVYKTPPAPVVLAPNWTGFYIGANAGGGWGTKTFFDETDPLFGKQVQVNGFLGGVQAGYNYQVNWVVFGIEGSFDWADLQGNFEGFAPKVSWLATATGRIGGAVDHALLYVMGGVAWAHDNYDVCCFAHNSETRAGGLLGAGIEYAFTPNWSGKIEYHFIDFGKKDLTFCEADGDCFTDAIDQKIHTVTVGVNYKFDWR
jgi:outer membrane immunogenic protein